MSIERYEGEIMNLTKEGIDVLMNKMYIDINPNMVEKDINYLLRKFVIKLVELEKYEFIHRAFNDCEKLKEMMEYYPEDADYFYHHYLRSTTINGRYLDAICLYEDEEVNLDEKFYNSEFYEKINFNFARAYMNMEKYDKAINIIQKNKNTSSKLLEAHIYSLMNIDKEILIYNSIDFEKENANTKSHIFGGYSRYYLKRNDLNLSKEYLQKLKDIMIEVPREIRCAKYYEIAMISKELGEEKDYHYYLEHTASAQARGEVQLQHKLKSILELFNLNILNKEDAFDFLPRERYLLESDIIKEYIEKIRGL